ncbi:unnamed protein product [Durusdinium trenchii]|uniref:Uncharacterized protein n=2 Tax=Durusdinium trenchii TaxID=1381693 RepID=A0ABP0RN20_9DINO
MLGKLPVNQRNCVSFSFFTNCQLWGSALVDYLDDMWQALGVQSTLADFLVSVVPVACPDNSIVLSAIDFHPFSWAALGIMFCSSGLISLRAKRYRYQPQRQELALDASRVLLLSSVVQCGACFLEHARLMEPLAISLHLSSPFLFFRFLGDSLILPHWVTSIGRGMGKRRAKLTYCYSALGNLFQVAAVFLMESRHLSELLLVPAGVCMAIASFRVSQWYPAQADLKASSYLLALYMLSGVIIEALGVSHEIGQEQMLVEFAILDVVGKVPSCHLFTRGLTFQDIDAADAIDAFRHLQDRLELDIPYLEFEGQEE